MSPALSLDNVSCTFLSRDDPSQRYTAVSDTTLIVGEGEFVSVVGPTGCGKTTLLNVAAGLLAPSTGHVKIFGDPLAGINSRAGYMFQSDALMPWRNTIENVIAGLEFRGITRTEALEQGNEWLQRVGLSGFGGALSPPALGRHAQARGAGADAHSQPADPAHGRTVLGT